MPGPYQAALIIQVFIRFLTVMKHGYIGEFEIIDDHRAGKIVVNLTGRLNKGGVSAPDLMCTSEIQKNGRITCFCPTSLVSLYQQPHLASWTMKKQDKNTQEGKYLHSFPRDVIHTNKMSQRTKKQLFLDFFLGKLDQIIY